MRRSRLSRSAIRRNGDDSGGGGGSSASLIWGTIQHTDDGFGTPNSIFPRSTDFESTKGNLGPMAMPAGTLTNFRVTYGADSNPTGGQVSISVNSIDVLDLNLPAVGDTNPHVFSDLVSSVPVGASDLVFISGFVSTTDGSSEYRLSFCCDFTAS